MPRVGSVHDILHLSKVEMHFKWKFSYVIFTGKVIILVRLFLLANQLKCSLFAPSYVFMTKIQKISYLFFTVLYHRIVIFSESEDLLPVD